MAQNTRYQHKILQLTQCERLQNEKQQYGLALLTPTVTGVNAVRIAREQVVAQGEMCMKKACMRKWSRVFLWWKEPDNIYL